MADEKAKDADGIAKEAAAEKAKAVDYSEYRQHLMLAGQKSQDDYDKTTIALSGGALGISFAFLKDFLGTGQIENVCLLLVSWIAWGFSTAAVLVSFYTSHLALRETMDQVDDGRIAKEKPGGVYTTITARLNLSAGILFLVGVFFMVWFMSVNLSNRRVDNGKAAQPSVTTPSHPTDSEANAPAKSPPPPYGVPPSKSPPKN